MYADKRTYSVGTPLTTSFADTAAQVLFETAPSGGSLFVINTTSDVIAIVFGTYKKGEVPSSSLPGKSYLIPAAPGGGSGALAVDTAKISKNDKVWIRAVNTSQTSGTVYFFVK